MRERQKKRNTNVRNIHQLPPARPLMGIKAKTYRACALSGNQTSDLFVHRTMLIQLSHTCQGCKNLFIKQTNKKHRRKHKNITFYLKNIFDPFILEEKLSVSVSLTHIIGNFCLTFIYISLVEEFLNCINIEPITCHFSFKPVVTYCFLLKITLLKQLI